MNDPHSPDANPMWSLIASRVAYIFKLLVNRVRPALENIPAGSWVYAV
jgi:hypothetical protein